jgi:hypothetical protein
MYQQPPNDVEPHDEDDAIDPEDLYPFDEFLDKQEVLEEIQLEMVAVLKVDFEVLDEGRRHNSGTRRYLSRPREEANHRLMDHYFSENPVYNATIFRRRIKMRSLFCALSMPSVTCLHFLHRDWMLLIT